MSSRRARTALAVAAMVALSGCGATDGDASPSDPTSTADTPPAPTPSEAVDPDSPGLDVALSSPREDSVYPDVGDPSVDALHYDLDLTWDPDSDTLTGQETLIFRSTATADGFQLDLGEPLEIETVSLDGADVDYEHDGKDLVVSAAVTKDERYQLTIAYAGTPEPVEAPTTRSDLSTTGFTIDPDHETWTMQEPYGAFTWYAVNDQPADKALYDFSLHVPAPWVGIANGEQTASTETDGTMTTDYRLAEPASSYLVTLAFGDYRLTEQKSSSGTPIDLWIPAAQPDLVDGPSTAPDALDFLEKYLGPYPFDTAGILVVDSESGMETQTLITLGDTDYSTSPEVVVHEFAHQWYGDRVTPNDWRDVWMNEGMAMYLQLLYEADEQGISIDQHLAEYAVYEKQTRREAGPPGDYEPGEFGSSNIYFGPAFMWNEIRKRIGDREFYALVRSWPESQDNTSTDRETLERYWTAKSGEDLSDLFDAWLLSPTTPPIS